MDRLLLIDGSNLLFQMFYGMPSRIVNQEGKAIHGTMGFLGALLKMIRMIHATHVAVLFDGEHDNPRTALYSAYKANRTEDARRENELPFSQLNDIYRVLSYLDIAYAETTDCEADDWIAGYALQYANEMKIVVASMDSDFFQLIGPNVRILRYRGKSSTLCDEIYLQERFGISAKQYVDFKSLTGDPADNIPGVSGIGPKTAAQLLTNFGSVDGIIKSLDQIKRPSIRNSLMQNKDRLNTNQKLIRLNGVKEFPFTITELSWKDAGMTTVQILKEIGLY